jgi:hypothetical protein
MVYTRRGDASTRCKASGSDGGMSTAVPSLRYVQNVDGQHPIPCLEMFSAIESAVSRAENAMI